MVSGDRGYHPKYVTAALGAQGVGEFHRGSGQDPVVAARREAQRGIAGPVLAGTLDYVAEAAGIRAAYITEEHAALPANASTATCWV